MNFAMNHEIRFHAIKDPVHGTMQFTSLEDQWIKPFIDSPTFQRLRHIKQMGMGDFIFPGAVHTRFNHSLGCCFVASQIAHKIGLSEEERQLVMIACLLHDIGHGPFSHTFEDVFIHKLIRHESWTPYFLAEYRNHTFFNEYHRRNPNHFLSEQTFSLIENMIMHKARIKPVLADVVSSQLDADRLDYLLRDSHFCGVTYGTFDLRWMLNSMTIVTGEQGERLGLTHKGIGVVEHYLMARRLMIRNIYHHQKKLAFEFYLIQLFLSLAENLAHHTLYDDIKQTRLGKFLIAANEFNHAVIHGGDPALLKQHFLERHYSDYKELCDYDVFAVIKSLSQRHDPDSTVQLAKRLQYRQMPKVIRLDHVDSQVIQEMLSQLFQSHKKSIHDWQLTLIKTPNQSYSIEEDPILIVNEIQEVRPLNEISLMINAISDKYEHTTLLCIDSSLIHHKAVEGLVKKISRSRDSLSSL